MNTEKIPIVFGGKVNAFMPFLDGLIKYADLSTKERFALFMANVSHECADFTRLVENLNYSAKGLASIWPSRYANKNGEPNLLAVSLARQPEKIANVTYANRMGNGSPDTGDGWRYRGRGCIMTTGFDNYLAVDNEFNMNGEIVDNPDLLGTAYWAIMSAGFFWKKNRLNAYADKGDVKGCRKKINGGLIGVEDVQKRYNQIIKIL